MHQIHQSWITHSIYFGSALQMCVENSRVSLYCVLGEEESVSVTPDIDLMQVTTVLVSN